MIDEGTAMLPRTTIFDAVLFVPAAPELDPPAIEQEVSVRFWAYDIVQA